MNQEDNGWDDLFAKASGENVVATRNEKIQEKRRKKKRKRSKQKGKKDASSQLLLAGRLHVPNHDTLWPSSVHLKESILLECKGWKGRTNHSSCKRCGKNALYHLLRTVDDWPLQVFCCLRNLRCMGVLLALESVQVANVATNESRLLLSTVQSSIGRLRDDYSGENQVLESKCHTVMDTVQTIQANGNQKGDFETAARLMIACDDMYYRIYYLMIAGIASTASDGHSLPHPAQYFHIPYLAWVGMDEAFQEWKEFLSEYVCSGANDSGDEDDQEQLLRRELFSMRYGIDPFETTNEPPTKHANALSYLHHNRTMETALLFFKSGWMTSSDSAKQTWNALGNRKQHDNGLSRHDTPAPPILSEWRDSCRDRLCNLYAYATVPPESIQRIKTVLQANDIFQRVIEIGAGSGYLAALLKQQGVSVVALDLYPPGCSVRGESVAVNEYHGHTPGFVDIKKGGPSDLRRFAAANAAALLLCYPPPESSMAKEALETYLNIGGRCLVHIGEFGGLTGSLEFESLLLRSCYCVDRFPCLTWGTDAAQVTIWIRANDDDDDKLLLLPCSNCGRNEASRRCRLVRHVVYCGKECFQRHSSLLSVHLAMNMIPITADKLKFDNDCHFMPIQTGKRVRGTKAKRR